MQIDENDNSDRKFVSVEKYKRFATEKVKTSYFIGFYPGGCILDDANEPDPILYLHTSKGRSQMRTLESSIPIVNPLMIDKAYRLLGLSSTINAPSMLINHTWNV